ncbi:hypothetical protein TcWFU_002173 [Taenia crassiceps]|uniref:Dolichyl-diphosphooligosaccharide--protein glycosyltransferase subunit KCP2 n=1 Tax=Taenia crassiceps TaxID=6207 RepID=A0ABR4Q446_9CEST
MENRMSRDAMETWHRHRSAFDGNALVGTTISEAVNNLENLIFGNEFYAQLFPEVFLCILVSSFSVGSIHRICGTVCFLTSCACCYFLNRMSQEVYSSSTTAPITVVAKKKRS